MPVMDKLRKCAQKMGYRLDVPPDFERVCNEAYDALFDDKDDAEEKSTTGVDCGG